MTQVFEEIRATDKQKTGEKLSIIYYIDFSESYNWPAVVDVETLKDLKNIILTVPRINRDEFNSRADFTNGKQSPAVKLIREDLPNLVQIPAAVYDYLFELRQIYDYGEYCPR